MVTRRRTTSPGASTSPGAAATSEPAHLDLADGLRLPLQAVTETFAILAKRRSGKSNAAVVMAEEMYDHGLPWVAIDPKGDWWGVRAAGDGDAPGLSVTVFGGRQGDLPLEPTAGGLVADLVVEERLTCVLDVSEMDDPDRMRFLLDFARRLYARNTEPLHVFCEEADDYIAQSASKGEMAVVRAFTRLIKQGGTRGIGVTLITQRSAMLHKNALSQAEGMIALRTTAPTDRKVIAEWVSGSVDRAEIASELPALANGQAWVIAPHLIGEPAKVQFRRRRTFDSGATPTVGAAASTPRALAEVDLARITAAMAATIERAEAEDPKALRRRIAVLERDLADERSERQQEPGQHEPTERVVEVPALTPYQVEVLDSATERVREFAANASSRAEQAVAQIRDEVARMESLVAEVRAQTEQATAAARQRPDPTAQTTRKAQQKQPQPAAKTPTRPAARGTAATAPAKQAASAHEAVTPARQRLLDALSGLAAIGVEQAPKTQVALFAGVSPKSSGYANNLGALRSAGLIDYPGPGLISLTAEGREQAAPTPPPADTADLHGRVRDLLSPARWRLLEPLLAAYPDPVSRGDLAEAAGASASSSGYANNLGALRSLGLLDYPLPGHVIATDVLFLA